MTKPRPLFDLFGSYVEIDGWVIIDLNRETGSIHQYEDCELSAESFLVEVNTLPFLPPLRMPFPSMASAKELRGREVALDEEDNGSTEEREADDDMKETTEYEKVNIVTTQEGIRSRSNSDVEPLSPRQKLEQRWSEIKRVLTASPDDDEVDDDPTPKHNLDTESASESPENREFRPDDSPQREGSESPHTDPDFVQSSSDGTYAEWFLASETVGLSIRDSLSVAESVGNKSVSGGCDGEVEGAGGNTNESEHIVEAENPRQNQHCEMPEVAANDADVDGKVENTNSQQHSHDQVQQRKERRNIGLAASATAVVVAAIWMLERKYDLS
ncbi:hypothetical protein L207DRAFT_575776 [Hyaloscypha variabilis F]|uniref:Uncharacterized protein n=1 Tax=Hyaloscypha variabilis (strain UAMH 11265 / GT02V1 / F) TaxID=1149755 RepID=A0A2J6S883_HYAVF|nr:hypothetical protein L207DRAFT_575776 [Hyaloscypha variabilis F]